MGSKEDKALIYRTMQNYVDKLEKRNIPLWRVYLYGSYSKNTFHRDSDIDLVVFWDKDEIVEFNGNVRLMRLRWDVDLRIEPHAFARTDFDEKNPYGKEIVETGERII